MAGPARAPFSGGGFGRPPSPTGRHAGGWTPSAVNRGWARPAANLVTDRSTLVARGATVINDRRSNHRTGHDSWYRHHPVYGWGRYYSSCSYYPYYGSYPYGESYGSDYYPYYGSSSSSDEGAANTDQETAGAREHMDAARRAFQKAAYAEAQDECVKAIHLLPGDANLHEFLALCHFARGMYTDAADTLYPVLAAGPGWDWNTLSSFYPSAPTYTTQLRALERFVREYPKDEAGHFVLAYHYLALDDREAAVGQLNEVIKLQSGNKPSPGILKTPE